MNKALAIVILAAGSGERFGGAKLDAPLAGKPLGQHALDAARQLGLPLLVVTEPVPGFARDAADRGQADLLVNHAAASGLASSVALAASAAAESRATALLLVLADMPQVSTDTLRKLVAAVKTGRPAAIAYPDGRPGIPACFPADLFGPLAALTGDRGAAGLLRDYRATEVAVDPLELSDIDTPDELAELAARHRL